MRDYGPRERRRLARVDAAHTRQGMHALANGIIRDAFVRRRVTHAGGLVYATPLNTRRRNYMLVLLAVVVTAFGAFLLWVGAQ